MPMQTSEYWAQRFAQLEAVQHQDSVAYYNRVARLMEKVQADVEKDLNAWFARFAVDNQISMSEAKKLLNSKELKEFKWTVEDYIEVAKKENLSPQWEKALENASARYHISRLEAIQLQVQQKAEQLYGNYNDSIDDHMKGIYTEGYYHTAYEIQKGVGFGAKMVGIDEKTLEKVVTKPWAADGFNFSERVWRSKSELIDNLNTVLVRSCVMGQSLDKSVTQLVELTNAFGDDFKKARSQAARLIQTESAYFGSLSRQDCFNALDVEEYEIVATLDSRTSEICQDMDGKHFAMSEYIAGTTAPPFHVNCRTTTCPYFNDEYSQDDMRAARGTDGKTYLVPANTTYEDWRKGFAGESADPEKAGFTTKPKIVANISIF